MRAQSSMGLVFSAYSLAAFFWPESNRPAASFLSSLNVFLATSRALSNIVASLRLAAANSDLALRSPSRAASTIARRRFSSVVMASLSRFCSFSTRARRVFSYSESAVRRLVDCCSATLGFGPARSSTRRRISRKTARSRFKIAGSEVACTVAPEVALMSELGIVRAPVVVVLTMTHSGRNSRGGPGRAPRRSFACR